MRVHRLQRPDTSINARSSRNRHRSGMRRILGAPTARSQACGVQPTTLRSSPLSSEYVSTGVAPRTIDAVDASDCQGARVPPAVRARARTTLCAIYLLRRCSYAISARLRTPDRGESPSTDRTRVCARQPKAPPLPVASSAGRTWRRPIAREAVVSSTRPSSMRDEYVKNDAIENLRSM